MVDLGAAEHAYGAIMKALYKRAVTGKGSRIDLSMFHSAVAWMANPLMLTRLGEQVTRRGNTHQYFGPVAVFPTRDGYAYVAIGNDRQWAALTRLPAFESLAQPEYERNAGRMAALVQLHQRIAELTSTLETDELIQMLHRIGVPVARVNTLTDVLREPLLQNALTRAQDARTGREIFLPPTPDVNDPGPTELTFPPRLGEHNALVYGDVLGLSRGELDDLKSRGII
jgi:formyl-CoA transferase